MWAVFRREFVYYFRTLTGFIFMSFFLLLSGIFFTLIVLVPQNPTYNDLLGSITFIFMIVVPILTMRLFAEETRQKTDQLLLTSPLSVTAIVLGKYFAALAVFLLTLIVTLVYPLMMSLAGSVSLPEIVGGYIGFFLLGSAFIAIGILVSSLTENQLIAAVVTFAVLVLIWILDQLQKALPGDRPSGLIFAILLVLGAAAFIYFTIRSIVVCAAVAVLGGGIIGLFYGLDPSIYEGLVIRALQWFSLFDRYRDFELGLLGLSPVVYYISFSSAFLFLTVRAIDKRRWR